MIEKTQRIESTKTISRQELALSSLTGRGNFNDLFQKKLEQTESLTFSKHAAQRMEDRGIRMDDSMFTRLSEAVDRAGEKGAKNIAVISEQGVFIVNVPNKIVVTGVSPAEMKENIVTNIDSAVLM